MSFQLPDALQTPDDSAALKLISRNFNSPPSSSKFHTGSQFDGWDSTGTREVDANRFTEPLTEVGADRDLVGDDSVLRDDCVGRTLMSEQQALPDVGPVTASKLFARNRPRLRPIYDDVVAAVTGSHTLWSRCTKHYKPTTYTSDCYD